MYRKTKRPFHVIILLAGMLLPVQALAQEGPMQATIYPIVGQPIVIQDFSINDELFYDAEHEGTSVKLPFRDLQEIRFINPGKDYAAEVTFTDGRKEMHLLRPAANVLVVSQHGIVSMSHNKLSRITFSPFMKQHTPSAGQAGLQTRADGPNTAADQVILNSGNSLSGQVQAKQFPMRTAYGNLKIETQQIAYIEFDQKRPNAAVVVLRAGDRLSGTVETDAIPFMNVSRETVGLDIKTIKAIIFRK